jgi:hypothetical protein
MTPAQSRFQNASNAAVIGTGLWLYWSKNLAEKADPYSNLGGPGEVLAHNSHILVAPFLVFAAGLLWKIHIWPRFRQFSISKMGILKGLSGLFMVLTLVPMILSGALIQITTDESARKVWVATHVFSSFIWVAASIFHLVKGRAR